MSNNQFVRPQTGAKQGQNLAGRKRTVGKVSRINHRLRSQAGPEQFEHKAVARSSAKKSLRSPGRHRPVRPRLRHADKFLANAQAGNLQPAHKHFGAGSQSGRRAGRIGRGRAVEAKVFRSRFAEVLAEAELRRKSFGSARDLTLWEGIAKRQISRGRSSREDQAAVAVRHIVDGLWSASADPEVQQLGIQKLRERRDEDTPRSGVFAKGSRRRIRQRRRSDKVLAVALQQGQNTKTRIESHRRSGRLDLQSAQGF